eukprot:365744-Chlamydomonas_euryale.AAC.12
MEKGVMPESMWRSSCVTFLLPCVAPCIPVPACLTGLYSGSGLLNRPVFRFRLAKQAYIPVPACFAGLYSCSGLLNRPNLKAILHIILLMALGHCSNGLPVIWCGMQWRPGMRKRNGQE